MTEDRSKRPLPIRYASPYHCDECFFITKNVKALQTHSKLRHKKTKTFNFPKLGEFDDV